MTSKIIDEEQKRSKVITGVPRGGNPKKGLLVQTPPVAQKSAPQFGLRGHSDLEPYQPTPTKHLTFGFGLGFGL